MLRTLEWEERRMLDDKEEAPEGRRLRRLRPRPSCVRRSSCFS